VEKCSVGLNPKVNNLIPAYRKARHPFVLISDSNVMVDRTPRNYAACAGPVGGARNLIRGVGGCHRALLENLHLNSFIIGSVSFLDRFLGMPCVIGKSMLMKKDDLEALGGLMAFKDILAEDFIIGREMHRLGRKVVLSSHLVNNVNEYWDVKRFLNRHTRWGKLRWQIGGAKYFSELLANPVFIAAIPAIVSPTRTTLSFAALVGLIKVLGVFADPSRAVSPLPLGGSMHQTFAAHVLSRPAQGRHDWHALVCAAPKFHRSRREPASHRKRF
jgi:ceramide glucosyltransferase